MDYTTHISLETLLDFLIKELLFLSASQLAL